MPPRSTMPDARSTGSRSQSPLPRREVDYYLNPTELFRWINYRRWDGAKSRASSHPEECSTWIVSKDSSSGKILWRRLPLHLVCMQANPDRQPQSTSGGTSSTVSTNDTSSRRSIEELIETLVQSYPDGAAAPDEEGMLPLHLAAMHGASERVMNILLMAYPNAPNVEDKYKRTPVDVIRELPPGPTREPKLRVLERARETIERILATARRQTGEEMAALQQSAANERVASQRIIMRMEEELAMVKKEREEVNSRVQGDKETTLTLEREIDRMKDQIVENEAEAKRLKKERNEMLETNTALKARLDDHDNVIDTIKQEAADERLKLGDTIANLKSDVATAKAMNDALESQLRSRFTNEEFLSASIVELEKNLQDTKKAYETSKQSHREREQELLADNTHLKKTVEDLTKRNVTMQSRISDLNKQISKLLANQSALNAEQDRLVESTARAEIDLIEEMRSERERVRMALKQQKQAFDAFCLEQQRIVDDGANKEREIHAAVMTERERAVKEIERLKEEFKVADLKERERKLQEVTRSTQQVTADSKQQSVLARRENGAILRRQQQQQLNSPKQQHPPKSSTRRPSSSPSPSRRDPLSPRQPPPPPRDPQIPSSSSRRQKQKMPLTPSSTSSAYDSYPDTPPKKYTMNKPTPNGVLGGPNLPIYSPTSMSSSDNLGPTGAGHLMRLLEDRAEENQHKKTTAAMTTNTTTTIPIRSSSPAMGVIPDYGPAIGGGVVPIHMTAGNNNITPRSPYVESVYSDNDSTSRSSSSVAYGFRTTMQKHRSSLDVRQDGHYSGSEVEF